MGQPPPSVLCRPWPCPAQRVRSATLTATSAAADSRRVHPGGHDPGGGPRPRWALEHGGVCTRGGAVPVTRRRGAGGGGPWITAAQRRGVEIERELACGEVAGVTAGLPIVLPPRAGQPGRPDPRPHVAWVVSPCAVAMPPMASPTSSSSSSPSLTEGSTCTAGAPAFSPLPTSAAPRPPSAATPATQRHARRVPPHQRRSGSDVAAHLGPACQLQLHVSSRPREGSRRPAVAAARTGRAVCARVGGGVTQAADAARPPHSAGGGTLELRVYIAGACRLPRPC